MTIQEFDNISFGAGDRAVYRGGQYLIASVDFLERLIGLTGVVQGADDDDVSWVRCENIEFIPSGTKLIFEQDLPEDITESEYNDWFDNSTVINGVRMGPKPKYKLDLPWIPVSTPTEVDGRYLVNISQRQECGTIHHYQKVIENFLNRWVVEDESEDVTHYIGPLTSPFPEQAQE